MEENTPQRRRGQHRPQKLIAFLVTLTVTAGMWVADTYYKGQIIPDQQYLQSVSMLKLIQLNQKYGVASVIDLYNHQTPSELADYLDKKTTVPVKPVFRVLEANNQKTVNQLIVKINGQPMVFEGLDRSDLNTASEEYSSVDGVEYAEPNYIIRSNAVSRAELTRQRLEQRQLERQLNEMADAIASQYLNTTRPDPLPTVLANKKRFDQPGACRRKQIVYFVPDSGMSDNPFDVAYADMGSELVGTNKYMKQTRMDQSLNGHGTHLVGIIAAEQKKGPEIYNLPDGTATILAYGVFVKNSVTASGLANTFNAIEHDMSVHVTANRLGIVNASFGSANTVKLIDEYIQRWAGRRNIQVLAAAGNNANKTLLDFPARNAIAVIAITDHEGPLADFSNYQLGYPKMYATPGVSITSAGMTDRYNNLTGSSQSTPGLVGILGLLLQLYPGVDATAALNACSKVNHSNTNFPVREVHLSYCR